MAITDINNEDRLVQQTIADHLHNVLGWDSVYAWKAETIASRVYDYVWQRSATQGVPFAA